MVTLIRSFKHETFFSMGVEGGGGAYSWYFTDVNAHAPEFMLKPYKSLSSGIFCYSVPITTNLTNLSLQVGTCTYMWNATYFDHTP